MNGTFAMICGEAALRQSSFPRKREPHGNGSARGARQVLAFTRMTFRLGALMITPFAQGAGQDTGDHRIRTLNG